MGANPGARPPPGSGEKPRTNAFSAYGWLGGFSYLQLIISTIGIMWRSIFTATAWQHHAIAINSVLLATILQGVQIDTDHWRHFYLLLGLSWGLYAATIERDGPNPANGG